MLQEELPTQAHFGQHTAWLGLVSLAAALLTGCGTVDPVAVSQRSLQTFQHVSHGDGSRLASALSYDLPLETARLARTLRITHRY
jgi:hypothetical protein